MVTSPLLYPFLMDIALAQSPISTDMFSVPTRQNFHSVLATKYPGAASRYARLLTWANSISWRTIFLLWLFFLWYSIWDFEQSLHIFLKLLIIQKGEVCHNPEFHALIEAPRAQGVVYNTCMHILCTQHTWKNRLRCRRCDPSPVSSTLLLLQDQSWLFPADPCHLLPSLAWLVALSPSWHQSLGYREPSSPWGLLAVFSPVVGLWAEVLAGEGDESLRVRRELILGRQDSPTVGSGLVPPPPSPFQVSIIFSNDCIGYKLSSVVNALIGFVSSLLSLVG